MNGSTGCRSVNVILVTDGDETCDTQADAVAAAQDLYQNGVSVGGKTFKVRVHVINFAGGSQANTDAIASACGTGASYFATNEVQLAQALSTIVSSSVAPETCDAICARSVAARSWPGSALYDACSCVESCDLGVCHAVPICPP